MVESKIQKYEDAVIRTTINNSKNINYIVGNKNVTTKPLTPYDSIICEFLNRLSLNILKNKIAKKYPDIITFAYWCRKSNINKLKKVFNDGKLRLGLGLAFHIAPSNVPINFAYTFVFGLLAGNSNIVRLPSKEFPQINIICNEIKKIFKIKKFDEIKEMTAFVKYDHNDKISSEFSKKCNVRIIWGGNETIRKIRQFALSERAIDITFADRYSFCLINSNSIIKLSQREMKVLALNFYNDTYLMDQNACSSPHLIIWHGKNKIKAKKKFWDSVNTVIEEKYDLMDVSVIDKYSLLMNDFINKKNIKNFKIYNNNIYLINLNKLSKDIHTYRGKWGYFYEYDINNLNEIAGIINSKFQTLTYFGFKKSILSNFIKIKRFSGIDRIVPIGKALDIQTIWDGYDIEKTLSRIIDIQ